MSRGRRANPALIGAFVLGAVVLVGAVVVVWGSGRFFRNTKTFVSYFSGSVNGLNPGAPVKFRGVKIGSVTEIRLRRADPTQIAASDAHSIPVHFDVDLDQIAALRGGRRLPLDRARLDELIARGLRAQLQSESFVTGVLYVGLDVFPDSPVVLVEPERPDVLEIPTVPTMLERASQTLTKLAAKLEKIDLEAALKSVTDAFDAANALVRSPEIPQTLMAARDALTSIQQLSSSAEPRVRPLLESLDATSTAARASLRNVDTALANLRTLIDTQGPLAVQLTQSLTDLGDAARSVRQLASYLDQKPNALLTGRPGS